MLIGSQKTKTADQGWVKDVTVASFVKDVLEISLKKPVLVNFWTSRSPACKTLSLLLEKLAHEAQGQWILAKVDVDTNPQLVSQLQIQSLPTVYMFKAGRPIDGFAGAVSEAQIRQFLANHVVLPPVETQTNPVAEAEALWNQDAFEEATHLLIPHVEENPQDMAAKRLLILCLYAKGKTEAALSLFSTLPQPLSEDVASLKDLFDLIEESQKEDLAASPDQYTLSLQQFAQGAFAQAMSTLIALLKSDKQCSKAHQTLLKMMGVIGIHHPTSAHIRRQLSAILFV